MNPGHRVLALGTAMVMAVAVIGTSPVPAEAAGGVTITVRCYSNPERTTIKNNRSSAIRINTVGSTYQPYSYEPFGVYKRLGAGMSITYQTGRAASKNVLTRNYIYNDNGADGVRVKTSVGNFTKKC